MRQVPQKNRNYLVVGNGKMARHLSTYFVLLNLPYHSWWRSSGENIYKKLLNSEKVLVAISDDAITKFTSSLVKEFPQKTFIHFSGLLCVPGVESAHPLMTFSNKLYDLNTYLKIPFVTEKKQKPFKVFHIKHVGYDTHLGQIHRLNNLYSDLGSCLKTFAYDLNRIGEWGNTQILVYSEFGRSIDENTNGGTDHGTAGPVFVLGGKQIYGNLADIKPIYKTYNIMINRI